MRLNMRQGVVGHQRGGFLHLNTSGDIDVLADNRTALVTVAHHDTDYLHSEDATVVGAWLGPFTSPKYWLYWDFDLTTFNRTFGHTTLEPITQSDEPGTGVVDIVAAGIGTDNSGYFVIAGQYVLSRLRTLDVSSSSDNDGTYTIFSSSYDSTLNQTSIFVSEDVDDNTSTGQMLLEFDADGLPLLTTGRMWYDTTDNIHYELTNGGAWVEVLRVVAAQITNGLTFSSHSVLESKTFIGTQIADTSAVLSGRVLFTEQSNVIIRDEQTFLTTEDQFLTNQSRVDALRLESNVVRAQSVESAIASFTVVTWVEEGRIGTAQYDHTESAVVGMLTEDVLLGEVGAVIVQGVITNPSWNWITGPTAVPIGSPLWIKNGALTHLNPHVTDVLTYNKSRVPVARVLNIDTIIFEQGLGGVGEIGPPGSVEVLPSASTVTVGAVTLVTPSSDPQRALVISDTDPRLTDARTPLPHTHPAEEIIFTPAGGLISNNVQLALTELGNTKLNVSGGTLTGTLTLSSNPTANLQAATKQYVDGLVNGLVWLDPIRLLNLISDNITSPPITPALSDAYIVPPGSVGDWSAITTGHIVLWNGFNWVDLGTVLSFDPVAARFGVAMQTTTSASGSFAGLDNQIVIYDNAGNIDSFEVPTINNAVFVNHTSSLHAFDQFAFDGTGWILFGGAAPVTADGVTTTLSANVLSIKQFGDGGINDVSHWQGLVPADLATTYSVVSHTHLASTLANTPYTSSPNWGTLQDPTEAHITSTTIQSALNELVDKKAGKQQAYPSLADTPDASVVSGMTVYVQDTGVLYYATGGSWVQLANQGRDLSIPYDVTFSITTVLQQDTIVGTYVSGRVVDLAPSLPNSIAYTTVPAVDGSYVFRILLIPISTGISVEIGTITFAVGQSFGVFNFPDAMEIGALDVLQIATDDANPPDSSLQDVGITITGCSIAAHCEPYTFPVTISTTAIFIENGLTRIGLSGTGTFGFDVPWVLDEFDGFAMSYNGFEVLYQTDKESWLLWKHDSTIYRLRYVDYWSDTNTDAMTSVQTKTSDSTASQQIVSGTVLLPTSPVSITRGYSLSPDDILTITSTIKNTTASNITNLYYMHSEDYDPDYDDTFWATATWQHNISDDLCTSYAEHNPVAIGYYSNDPIPHKCKTSSGFTDPEFAWNEDPAFYTTPVYEDSGPSTIFKIPLIEPDAEVVVTSYVIFGADEAAVIAKSIVISGVIPATSYLGFNVGSMPLQMGFETNEILSDDGAQVSGNGSWNQLVVFADGGNIYDGFSHFNGNTVVTQDSDTQYTTVFTDSQWNEYVLTIVYTLVGSNVNCELTINNTAGSTFTNMSLSVGIVPVPDWENFAQRATVNNSGHGVIPNTRITHGLGSNSTVRMALYTADEGITTNTRFSNDWDLNPPLILSNANYTEITNDSAITLAWDIGDLVVGGSATVNFSYLMGTDLDDMVAGLT